jgi:predicted DNA-binding mobile mystery protein A
VKTNRKSLLNQRKIMDRKVRPWTPLRSDRVPGSGWIKAVRGALGMSTRQLAARIGVQQSNITRLEEREALGKATIESVATAANAMGCKLIYAIVPDDRYQTLEMIVDERARDLARRLTDRAEHSMRLEKQGIELSDEEQRVSLLASELKTQLDPRIWGQPTNFDPRTK